MSARSRGALLVLAWVVYLGTWSYGQASFVGDDYTVMAFAPLIMGAWWFGQRIAVLSAAAFVPVQASLYLSSGHSLGWDALAGQAGATRIGGMILVTVLVGWASESNRGSRHLLLAQSKLVAEVSRDVRNPLTGVLGMSHELLQGWALLSDQTKREMVDLIARSAGDIAAAVDDLLTATLVDQGRLEIRPGVTDLGALAGSVVEQLGVPARVVGEAEAWADPARACQVIRNLVVNARSHGGQQISVQCGIYRSHAYVDVSGSEPAIPGEEMGTPFIPQVSGDQHRDSPVSGLALCHRLALAMGGNLTHRRVDGRTVSRLTLPRALIAASTSEAAQVSVGR